jgi:hypothetical protein
VCCRDFLGVVEPEEGLASFFGAHKMAKLFAATVLMLCFVPGRSVFAQQTENHSFQDPRVQVSVQDKSNGTFVTIQNLYSQPITAYAYDLKRDLLHPTPQSHVIGDEVNPIVDFVVYSFAYGKPIEPNESRIFEAWPMAPPGSESRQQVTLLAVIFADGTSAGDPEWITSILRARKLYLVDREELVQRLQSAQNQNEPPAQLLSDLQAARQALSKPTSPGDRLDWSVQDNVYADAIASLTRAVKAGGQAETNEIPFLISVYGRRIDALKQSKPPLGPY